MTVRSGAVGTAEAGEPVGRADELATDGLGAVGVSLLTAALPGGTAELVPVVAPEPEALDEHPATTSTVAVTAHTRTTAPITAQVVGKAGTPVGSRTAAQLLVGEPLVVRSLAARRSDT